MTSHCAVRQSVLSFIFQFNLPPHVTLCPRASDQLIVIPSVLNIRWWFRGFCELSNYTSVNYIKFTDPHSLSLPWSFFYFKALSTPSGKTVHLFWFYCISFAQLTLSMNAWVLLTTQPVSGITLIIAAARPTDPLQWILHSLNEKIQEASNIQISIPIH